MLKSLLFFAYSLVAYILAMSATLYLLGFIAGMVVPKTLNTGPVGPLWMATFADLGLIALFGLHHSATARRRFKARWTQIVSPVIERATYLLMSSATTALLVSLWRPIPVTLWLVENPIGVSALRASFVLVALSMILSTVQLGHFRFFGLAQAWDHLTDRRLSVPPFCERWLYALVRHPISLGWMLLPWLVPHVTVGQALFGIGIAVYVLMATPREEGDLEAELGETYRSYRERVSAFLPGLNRLVPDVLPANDDLP